MCLLLFELAALTSWLRRKTPPAPVRSLHLAFLYVAGLEQGEGRASKTSIIVFAYSFPMINSTVWPGLSGCLWLTFAVDYCYRQEQCKGCSLENIFKFLLFSLNSESIYKNKDSLYYSSIWLPGLEKRTIVRMFTWDTTRTGYRSKTWPPGPGS